jgi:hypothetical protein
MLQVTNRQPRPTPSTSTKGFFLMLPLDPGNLREFFIGCIIATILWGLIHLFQ